MKVEISSMLDESYFEVVMSWETQS